MKKIIMSIVAALVAGIIGFIYYYITLPAINIHSTGFWFFVIIAVFLVTVVVGILTANIEVISKGVKGAKSFRNKLFYIGLSITGILIAIFIVGSVASSPIVNAKKYRNLIEISERNFTEDIKQISYNEIPLLDRSTAILLGSRKMGSMVEYVSQFEVSEDYTQINYNGTPVRVTPLKYGSFIKWLNNHKKGIPAYIKIDMTTQDVECVKLTDSIKYSESELFGRNIHRYIRFRYPTYIFDNINFEIDEDGTPYWICPVKDFTIGLFGGQTISNVVIVNAITGEHTDYPIEEVPTWVDRVYSADLLISYYDYYGTLKHGYFNSLLSQKDCLKTTDGYNYIALEDDVWVYTGVTSVGGDESNVGFVLMNQRTAETRYYAISGAEEYSAMASAEGQVQHLNYVATFPLLLNIANEPTYFLALKDSAGLVKKYAMVNIEKYQIVAIGDSVSECEKTYISLLKSSGISSSDITTMPTITGTIAKIAQGVIDGNSHYYVLLEESDAIFDISVVDYINIIKYNVGDKVTFTYSEGAEVNTVLEVK